MKGDMMTRNPLPPATAYTVIIDQSDPLHRQPECVALILEGLAEDIRKEPDLMAGEYQLTDDAGHIVGFAGVVSAAGNRGTN